MKRQLELQDGPLRMPQNQSRSDVLLNREEVELLAQDPMVALLRFLEPPHVCVEVVLAEPRGAVDALQHLPPLVAAPIGAGGMEQLEVFDPTGARHVRASAEIDERAVRVHRDDLVRPQIVDPLELERVILEALLGLGPRDFLTDERIIRLHNLPHPLFNRLQILRPERALHLEVVVEAVLDRRSKTDLGLRVELAHRRGQDMGGGVPQHVERLRIVVRENRDLGPIRQRARQVPDLAVHPRGDGGLGEPRPNRLREVGAGGARGETLLAPVGERDTDLRRHQLSCPAGRSARPETRPVERSSGAEGAVPRGNTARP